MNELDYLDQIEENTSYIDNIWTDIDYIKSQNEDIIYSLAQIQASAESGEIYMAQQLEAAKRTEACIGTIALCVTLFLLYTFVKGCMRGG